MRPFVRSARLWKGKLLSDSYICHACRRRGAKEYSTTSGSSPHSPKAPPRSSGIQWKPIPIGLGIGFLGIFQLYRLRERAKRDEAESQRLVGEAENLEQNGNGKRPKRRQRQRPDGPWQVKIMSTLPLKAVSRLWGRFNELTIPYYLRKPGFLLYSWIFGVNISEAANQDLQSYPNLASFFYRSIRPEVRPLNPNSLALLSPADGRVLQFGTIEHGEVAQVKGIKYRLDELLGGAPGVTDPSDLSLVERSPETAASGDDEAAKNDEEFARMNGISYTLPNLFSGPDNQASLTTDASTTSKRSSEAAVRAEFAKGNRQHGSWFSASPKPPTALYYIVVYLAPGDYHRFHSPAAWIVEKRRHFAGELYSVSPYLQRTLPGLFTLNERVVLLGRWRWGFFSFCPVGATNVGSIKLDFDRELRTNSLTTDTAADRAAEQASERGEPYSGYSEATYGQASTVLGGHALRRGEEMGGFQLGSSIVMIFEAPKGQRATFDEGWAGGSRKGGWAWQVEKGQKIKYGEAIGVVESHDP